MRSVECSMTVIGLLRLLFLWLLLFLFIIFITLAPKYNKYNHNRNHLPTAKSIDAPPPPADRNLTLAHLFMAIHVEFFCSNFFFFFY